MEIQADGVDYRSLIEGLTEKQREVLGMIAMNQDGGHHPRTMEALMKRGLIEQYDEILGGRFPVRIKRYALPIYVHIAWCEWCSVNVSDEDES